jgi:hypothetical protein
MEWDGIKATALHLAHIARNRNYEVESVNLSLTQAAPSCNLRLQTESQKINFTKAEVSTSIFSDRGVSLFNFFSPLLPHSGPSSSLWRCLQPAHNACIRMGLKECTYHPRASCDSQLPSLCILFTWQSPVPARKKVSSAEAYSSIPLSAQHSSQHIHYYTMLKSFLFS